MGPLASRKRRRPLTNAREGGCLMVLQRGCSSQRSIGAGCNWVSGINGNRKNLPDEVGWANSISGYGNEYCSGTVTACHRRTTKQVCGATNATGCRWDSSALPLSKATSTI